MDKKSFSLGRILLWFGFIASPEPVMVVDYYPDENKITCSSWVSEKIIALSGKYSDELFNEIKKWCDSRTYIYIWSSAENRHLAYHEPIENYLDTPALLKTGQGFATVRDGNYQPRIGDTCRLRCKACGQYLPDKKTNHG